MKKIQENNQIEKENKTSKFYIAECELKADGTMMCNNAINLINKTIPERIKLDDNYYYFVVDQNGKVIHQLNKRSQKEHDPIEYITIHYVKDNKLVITQESQSNRPIETNYINYVPRNVTKRVLYDIRKGGRLEGIEVPNPNKEVIVITRKNKKTQEYDSRLFSIAKGKFISPSFSRLIKTKDTGDDILMFEDDIKSNKVIDKKRYETTLTGFITLDGVIGNTVYDSDIERTRDIGLKAGKLMEQYKYFRNKVKEELDYKFEVEKQVERRKQKFTEQSIIQLKKKIVS